MSIITVLKAQGCVFGRRVVAPCLVASAVWLSTVQPARAQGGGATGEIAGRVVDTARAPATGAVVHLRNTTLGARVGADGGYTVPSVPVGSYTVDVRAVGFLSDSFEVTVAAGQRVQHDVRLHTNAAQLKTVVVKASPRLNETVEAARATEKNAENIVNVESGDEIRSLPALNAAEAAERVPGVTTERDEGEGKFVQIRGLEPGLQNVTVDGSHIPPTLSSGSGSDKTAGRPVKLDDVPSDLIAALEVSKTLSADQDADAIGGSINIVTKVPEGRPHGYLAGQYGQTTLEGFAAYQGSAFYGGRVGENQKFGFLVGGTADRNNRPINDVELAWSPTTSGANPDRYFPASFDQRDYRYFRSRFGADIDLDYQFSNESSVFIRGLYSQFLDHGFRYVYNVSASADGAGGFGVGGTASRQVEYRTPIEQLLGVTAGGRKGDLGPFQLDYQINAGGTGSRESDYRTSGFPYIGAPFAYQYNARNIIRPTYTVPDASTESSLQNPNNYVMGQWDASNSNTDGLDLGGSINLLARYALGDLPAAVKFGVRYRNEGKFYQQHNALFTPNTVAPVTMSALLGNFSDPHFYSNVFNFQEGQFASVQRTIAYQSAHLDQFANNTDSVGNALSSYGAREQVMAAYVMHDLDVDRLHVNVGLRFEATRARYTAFADSNGTVAALTPVAGTSNYNDLFPSAQLRYSVDQNTDIRLALTRGIARADFAALAPSLTGVLNPANVPPSANQSLTAGNPRLKPETAWNYDLLAAHYLPAAGVISAGLFFKDLHDFIYNQRFLNYQGPYLAFHGYGGIQPRNGSGASLYGYEADWSQHLVFLPGFLSGIGFDFNWTHVDSHATVIDSTQLVFAGGDTTKPIGSKNFVSHRPLFRTSPNVGNASFLYDYGSLNIRLAWVYQGANIAAYGNGRSDATAGDNYFYAHSQIDGAMTYTFSPIATALSLQVLNMNNAVFGFFNGTPGHQYDTQREYYGTTFYLIVRRTF